MPPDTDLTLVSGPNWWGQIRPATSPPAVVDVETIATSEIGTTWLFPIPTLLVSDVDSTLIDQEVIDELAALAGVGQQVADITERAMQGELDFAESLTERVALLKGLPESVFADVYADLTVRSGASTLIDWVHAEGGKVAIVSGGFTPIVEMLAADLGIDFALANDLEIIDGHLTGRVTGEIVTADKKRDYLRLLAEETGMPTVALGDGANDIPMMEAADVGIAVCAKPRARAAVNNHLDVPQ